MDYREANEKALVLEIKGNSLDDGPGIRSVVFFKGCPLSCVWCHNPESKKSEAELSFDYEKCIGCRNCMDVCHLEALSKDNPYFVDRKICNQCFSCVDVCPSGAFSIVGKTMDVQEVYEIVLKDRVFYETSGGGVTISGGEPCLYMDFASSLFSLLKKKGIATLVETCGYFDYIRFIDLIYPFAETIYFDIKIIDDYFHRMYCGVSNRKILKNFRLLYEKTLKDGKTLLPRTPLIPKITDTRENLEAIAQFLEKLGVREAGLLEYNPLWLNKTGKIGKTTIFKDNEDMTSFTKKERLDSARAIFKSHNISCI